jgi:hypothetical protein
VSEHLNRFEKAVLKGLSEHDGERGEAVVTWRYLRGSLVLMAVGLLFAVGYEVLRADCWQQSISAYYYTPVEGILVGALVAIGIALVCLRGASDGEDVLLNWAGLCAPFVALVPTDPPRGGCGPVVADAASRDLSVGNNVSTLFVLLAIGLVAAAAASLINERTGSRRGPSSIDRAGFGIAVLALLVAAGFFLWDRDGFINVAHPTAAISLFVLIFVNVVLNAYQRSLVRKRDKLPRARFDRHPLVNRYSVIAALMLVDVVVHVVLVVREWPYTVFSIEATLVILFGFFWGIQTVERWRDGVTPRPRPRPGTDPQPVESVTAAPVPAEQS